MRLLLPSGQRITTYRTKIKHNIQSPFLTSLSSLDKRVNSMRTHNKNNMTRRGWISTTTAGLASSIVLATLHNNNYNFANAFVPSPPFMKNHCIQEKPQSLLFSTTATVSEAADEASSTEIEVSSSDENSVPGLVLHQSHRVVAIKLLVNEDESIRQTPKEETKTGDASVSSSTGMFQQGGMNVKQKNKKQDQGMS